MHLRAATQSSSSLLRSQVTLRLSHEFKAKEELLDGRAAQEREFEGEV